MAYPDLNTLFLSSDYRLPYLESDDTKSFLFLFEERMKKFVGDLKGMDELTFKSALKDIIVADVEQLAVNLKRVLKLYLDGYPSDAYVYFKNIVETNPLFQDLNYSRILRIEGDTSFYRSKKAYELTFSMVSGTNGFNGSLSPHEMFHVPFEKRRSIGTNRYSIPGFPCIYLSDHLQTSWSECIGGDTEPFHAICYRNHRALYLVDLVPLNVLMEQNNGCVPENMFATMNSEQALINYTLVYPIICACHSKIEYIESSPGEVKFKSEYIIPQLLMQWYRERKLLVDGIRYLSCTAEARFPGITFNKHNFVIPVDECLEAGLSPNLLLNFSGTQVYTYNSPTGKSVSDMLSNIQQDLFGECNANCVSFKINVSQKFLFS